MSYHAAHDKDISKTIEALASYGFNDPQELIDIMCRVMKTKKELLAAEADTDTVYRTMQGATSSMVRFPGDADLFHQLYNLLSSYDEHDILSFMHESSEERELKVPESLIAEFAEHITDTVKKVLIPDCEKYDAKLLEIIKRHPEVIFVLTCKQETKHELLSLAYGAYSNVKVQMTDILNYGFTSEKFDLIIALPLFENRVLVNNKDFISRDSNLITVQNLLYHLNTGGELVIILSAIMTFAGGSTAALRSFIETNYKIKEIGTLPPNLFAPHTAIRTFLFVFSTGETDDVVLKQYDLDKSTKKETSSAKLLPKSEQLLLHDEFTNLNGWNIDIALLKEDEEFKAFSASQAKKIHLKEVATLFRGKVIKTKDEHGNIGVIKISNISDTEIDYSSLDRIVDEERKVSNYLLQDGDVLITVRGTTIKTAVFEAQPIRCIPSANITVIRPKEMLNGTYLKLFLESPVGRKLLKSLERGTILVNINCKDIGELEVPLPPLESQEDLVRIYKSGLNSYKKSIATAEKAWHEVQSEIRSRLY